MFLYIESVKVPPFTSRLTKIDVVGSIFDPPPPLPDPQHGVQGRSHLGQICGRGDILNQARNRFLPLLAPQIPTHWDTSGAGGGRGGGVHRPVLEF